MKVEVKLRVREREHRFWRLHEEEKMGIFDRIFVPIALYVCTICEIHNDKRAGNSIPATIIAMRQFDKLRFN